LRNILLLISLALLISGCTSSGSQNAGSANYQRCASQCGTGNGTYCLDGCKVQEAQDTNSTLWCDQLDNKANRPSCYSIVAKSSGDIGICDRLPSGIDRNQCISNFGPV
jgi:uncharacterized protein YceK